MELAPLREWEPDKRELSLQESQDPTGVGAGSSPVDFMLCDSGSKLVSHGFTAPPSSGEWFLMIFLGVSTAPTSSKYSRLDQFYLCFGGF